MTYALVRSSWHADLDLATFARATGTHPDLVRRLVALGVIDARQDPSGELWFPPSQVATYARAERLRAGLALNYAAIGLVMDLLDRIAVLEAALRRAAPAAPQVPGTRRAPNPRARPGNYPGG